MKRGDQVVFMAEKDGSMRIAPRVLAEKQSKPVEWIIDADLCDEPGMLQRLIVGNYIHGRDTISVVSQNRLRTEYVREVRSVIQRLIGLGIVEETPSRITLQCSVDPSKFPIDVVMRRLYILAAGLHQEAMQALIELDYPRAKEVGQMDNEVDMLYWLITRLLLSAQHDRVIAEKIGITEPLHMVGNRLISKFLESIADSGEIIARNVADLEKANHPPDKTILNALMRLSDLASKACKEAIDCMTTRDIKLANSAISVKQTVQSEELRIIDLLTKNVKDTEVLARLRAIAFAITDIAKRGCEIAEISINRVLEKSTKFARETPLAQ